MPTVPQRSVGTAPLPGVRVNPNVPVAAFPGAINARPDLSGVQHVVNDLHQQAVARADQVANLDNDNQLSQAASQIEQNALSLKGKNAMGALQQARADWEKQTAGIGVSAATDRQKMFLQARAAMRWQQLNETIERHAASEGERYDDDTTQAAIKNRVNDVMANYADPNVVGSSISEAQAVLRDYASRKGWSPETTDQAVAETTSQMHSTVLRQFASAKQLPQAVQYYNDHKDQFVGEDAAKASALASAAQIQNDGDTAAQSILKGDDPTKPLSASDAFTKAEAIDDPNVRKIATEAVLQHFTRLNQLQNIERDNARAKVMQDLEASGGHLNTASPNWQTINGFPEGEQVLARQHQLLHPPPDPGDPDKYNSFVALSATSPETRQALGTMNIADVLADKTMSGGQKTAVINLIRGARSAAAALQLADARQQRTDLEQSIKEMQRSLKSRVDAEGNALSDDAVTAMHNDLLDAQAHSKVLELQVTRLRHGETLPTSHASDSAPSGDTANHPVVSLTPTKPKPLTADLMQSLRESGTDFPAYSAHLRAWGYDVPTVLPPLPVEKKPK